MPEEALPPPLAAPLPIIIPLLTVSWRGVVWWAGEEDEDAAAAKGEGVVVIVVVEKEV